MNLIMPEQVARFFLFDGELLQEYEELLLEDSDMGSKIKDSIEKILGVPVLTNGATDTGTVLDGYQKAKTKIAQSNKQTEQLGSQIAVLEAELQEHTYEIERLRSGLSSELGKKSDLEGEMEQNEHVRTLIGNMNALENSIGEKENKTRGATFNNLYDYKGCLERSRWFKSKRYFGRNKRTSKDF